MPNPFWQQAEKKPVSSSPNAGTEFRDRRLPPSCASSPHHRASGSGAGRRLMILPEGGDAGLGHLHRRIVSPAVADHDARAALAAMTPHGRSHRIGRRDPRPACRQAVFAAPRSAARSSGAVKTCISRRRKTETLGMAVHRHDHPLGRNTRCRRRHQPAVALLLEADGRTALEQADRVRLLATGRGQLADISAAAASPRREETGRAVDSLPVSSFISSASSRL